MNPFAVILVFCVSVALFTCPRRLAPIPLLFGCCYMTVGQGLELGPISLPVYRIVLLLGALRVLSHGEWQGLRANRIDKLMIAWSLWVLFASLFRERLPGSGPVFTAGVVYDQAMFYGLIRMWVRDLDDIKQIAASVGILVVPIALEMIYEKSGGRNLFAVFGAVPEEALQREGRIRAQGPFRHPILAGTVGAICVPLMFSIWRERRTRALTGIAAGVVMVVASASSGPVMTLILGVGALLLWHFRVMVPTLLVAAGFLYLAAEVVMERPAYYLLSKIDITGGSTGWHRSRLIEAWLGHFGEWWLVGTDHTRHWMPHGVPVGDGRHIDITNQYISFAITGGLVGLLLCVAMILTGFRWVGAAIRNTEEPGRQFAIWCLGATLFAHAGTCIAVTYFDQSMMFLWLTIAAIGSLHSALVAPATAGNPAPAPPPVGAGGDPAWSAPPDGTPFPQWRRVPIKRDDDAGLRDV